MSNKTYDLSFNLFDEGRKYTGHHRNYILESARTTATDPATMERINLREAFGYLGHQLRQMSRKLTIGEKEVVKVNGKDMVLECIPSNVTTQLTIHNDGLVEHTQEVLNTKPGQVVQQFIDSKVGGFSWATGGIDHPSATHVKSFHGFDYVKNPGFSANRPFILESADAPNMDLILESICMVEGVDNNDAEVFMNSFEFELDELRDRLFLAEVYESTLTGQIGEKDQHIIQLQQEKEAARQAREQLIMEGCRKSIVVIPDRVQAALLNLEKEEDFNEIVAFFESARQIDTSHLPLDSSKREMEKVTVKDDNVTPHGGSEQYGSINRSIDWTD